MHLLDKIKTTLVDFFNSFDPQQAVMMAQNIQKKLVEPLSPAHQVLLLMDDKNIKLDDFSADKYLPLLHFYLPPIKMQQAIFLSQAKLAQLQQSFHSTKTCDYLDCFYQLQAGKLQVVNTQQSFHQNMILYSELSPLQQLEAQKLLKQKRNVASA
ncbi:hypothetical protein [Psychromonas antarctica]|uniref:hypothetical protein n=1 Tax=Psychromonas antarctica TaxID=67573 RepID=UPI001EE7F8FC|nr:hypothetical protein [Psychromonas antarctica]MCG6199892.1 hypothetical protein [Psychromonas antarctica]